MFLLAGAAASVLDYLGSLQTASSALQGSAAASAAASRPAFDISSAMGANNAGAGSPTDGGGNWSSPATMDALISTQGQATAGSTASTSAGSINLLERMIAQHAQLSMAPSIGHSLSTFV